MRFEEGAKESHLPPSPQDSVFESNYLSPALFPELKETDYWSDKEKEDCKKYFGYIQSIAKVRNLRVGLYPVGCPTTVKIMYRNSQWTALCHYCPSATFNAYCYLLKECEADVNVLVENLQNKSIASCNNYYSEKIANNAGTPPLQYPKK